MAFRWINSLLCAILLAARAVAIGPATAPVPYATKAREVTDYLQKTFCDPKTGLYVRSPTDRKPDYIWREAAAFSALVGAARHEPRIYGPLMAKHFRAMEVYWDTQTPIPAYEPAPTRGTRPR